MRRGIAAILGSRIRRVLRPRCGLKPIAITPRLPTFRRRVAGRTIAELGRVGKRVVIRLDAGSPAGGEVIVIEPRMTGLVLLAEPPDRQHLRLVIELEGRTASELLFWDRRGLGSVRLLTAAEFAEQFGPGRVGPDALGVSAELLKGRLGASRREIKVALLDQRAVAGIGNLYASEILHRAGIHPRRRCDKMRAGDWRRLEEAITTVLEAAIRYEGSTLADGTYRNALNEVGGYQNHHRVYDRAGHTCRGCGRGAIQRIVQAQRSTYFCPVCQPRG